MEKIDWQITWAVDRDTPKIKELTELHSDQEMPYTLDSDLTRAFLKQILVVFDGNTDEVGCFEHVIEAPFSIKDKVFLKAIKQFPYIDRVQPGELVNCCQSSGIGKGSHRALYQYQREHWPKIWTWVSVKSPLWPVLMSEGWTIPVNSDTTFFNIWKGAESTFRLALGGYACGR